jgi:hypothetical protein
LTLTPAGEELLRRSPDALQDRLVASLAKMPSHRRTALLKDLEQLVDDAGLDGDRPRLFFEEE